MTFSCPVSASWDLSLGLLSHSYWMHTAPPAPDTYIPSFEVPWPMHWTGIHLGMG